MRIGVLRKALIQYPVSTETDRTLSLLTLTPLDTFALSRVHERQTLASGGSCAGPVSVKKLFIVAHTALGGRTEERKNRMIETCQGIETEEVERHQAICKRSAFLNDVLHSPARTESAMRSNG